MHNHVITRCKAHRYCIIINNNYHKMILYIMQIKTVAFKQ